MYYDGIAPGYDELYGEEQDRKLEEFLERVQIPPGAALLDVGCGTGRSARMLDVSWHGIEPSQGLIGQASPDVRARIVQGKAESLPYPDASFAVVLSLTALQNFEDPAKGLSEMRRVCSPGGLVLVSFLKKSDRAELLEKLVRETLDVHEGWEQEKDLMFVCGH